MIDLSRRAFLIGGGALASAHILPAFAQRAPNLPAPRMISVNGIEMAVHEAGSGPMVVLLHGFPGLSFTWRHQIPALVSAGYRVVAPDLRGYGLTSRPERVEDYDIEHLTGDVVGLLDALDARQAVLVGHDWGGLLAWQTALFHRDRVAGVAGINAPYLPHWTLWLHPDVVQPVLDEGQTFAADPAVDPIAQMREIYSPDMYVLLFQDVSGADAAMNADPRATLRNTMRKDLLTSAEWSDLAPEVANMEYYGQALPDRLPGTDVPSPDELEMFAGHFERTGFTPAINWYRNISRNWERGRDLDQTIRVPSLVISGEHDVVLRPSMADDMDPYVPDLRKHVIADSWHWTPEEKPEEVNRLLVDWLETVTPS